MKKAQIENGQVVNIIEVDHQNIPDWCASWPEATPTAQVGSTYANGVFTMAANGLEQRRATASLPRLDFCLALMRLQIMPVDECKAAARGEWPATFAGFVASMSPSDAAEVEIRWATAQNIEYGNGLLQGLALVKAGGDPALATSFLDAIFGIA